MFFGKGNSQAKEVSKEEAQVVDTDVAEQQQTTDDPPTPAAPAPDAIDRFFGFTERLVCSAGNTTDVVLDPILLRKEEEKRMVFSCGPQDPNLIFDDDHVTDVCQQLLAKIAVNKALEVQKTLETSGSNDSGNTEAVTLDGSTTSKRRRFRLRGLIPCKGREIENSVIVSATPRSTHYEVSA